MTGVQTCALPICFPVTIDELNNPENPIIFGFGDDVDKRYQEFEDLDDNRYLENFKSIAYSQTDHYKRLMMETGRNFTNSSVFQSKKIKLNFSKF